MASMLALSLRSSAWRQPSGNSSRASPSDWSTRARAARPARHEGAQAFFVMNGESHLPKA